MAIILTLRVKAFRLTDRSIGARPFSEVEYPRFLVLPLPFREGGQCDSKDLCNVTISRLL